VTFCVGPAIPIPGMNHTILRCSASIDGTVANQATGLPVDKAAWQLTYTHRARNSFVHPLFLQCPCLVLVCVYFAPTIDV
jgi:hypothetical protein